MSHPQKRAKQIYSKNLRRICCKKHQKGAIFSMIIRASFIPITVFTVKLAFFYLPFVLLAALPFGSHIIASVVRSSKPETNISGTPLCPVHGKHQLTE
jgi:hypothetical protein